jgi:hypothetical protein
MLQVFAVVLPAAMVILTTEIPTLRDRLSPRNFLIKLHLLRFSASAKKPFRIFIAKPLGFFLQPLLFPAPAAQDGHSHLFRLGLTTARFTPPNLHRRPPKIR